MHSVIDARCHSVTAFKDRASLCDVWHLLSNTLVTCHTSGWSQQLTWSAVEAFMHAGWVTDQRRKSGLIITAPCTCTGQSDEMLTHAATSTNFGRTYYWFFLWKDLSTCFQNAISLGRLVGTHNMGAKMGGQSGAFAPLGFLKDGVENSSGKNILRFLLTLSTSMPNTPKMHIKRCAAGQKCR